MYYVYVHYDPATEDWVYIGHGKGSRAWYFNGGESNSARSVAHNTWCQAMCNLGYLPTEFVTVLERGLTKEQACLLEQRLIREERTAFNAIIGQGILKMTPDKVALCRQLREKGVAYGVIAKEIGLSTMAVWRALNGETKNVNG
jgi:hypothetical protein